MKILASDFLGAHRDSWTAGRAPEFSVVNVHAVEVPAPAAKIFSELGTHDLLAPGAHWKFLFGVRAAIGKLFGWDRGRIPHRPGPIEAGRHYAFFLIEHLDDPRELGMSVENRLTHAVMSWILKEVPGGTMVLNVTCANFHVRRGRLYWRVIRPFHDGIIESSLQALRKRVEGR